MKNNGIIPINKPSGWTSFDVVNKIKHMVKPLKVGHLGTLDPMATGVLLVTIGKATKLFDLMQEKEKTYIAEFKFGMLTDTLDITGEVLETRRVGKITLEMLEKATQNLIGEIDQIPPKYSAKSINGKRAYELARNNIEFEIPAKRVKIFNIDILKFNGETFELKISCGSGTYIRAIGRDIAKSLGTIATMSSLVRTSVGSISLEDSINIESLSKDNVFDKMIQLNNVLNYSELLCNEQEKFKLLNGQLLDRNLPDGVYKLNDNEDTVALIKITNNKAKMLLFLG